MAVNQTPGSGLVTDVIERGRLSPVTVTRWPWWLRSDGGGQAGSPEHGPRAHSPSVPLVRPAQCDQTGFLFWMKAVMPSCPSRRATLSTMVWEARW